MLITVYRIENCVGCGPYWSFEGRSEMEREHSCSLNHPVPHVPDRLWRCGFADLDQLKIWFSNWLPGLLSKGFVIRRYLVERVKTSNGQLVFDLWGAYPYETVQLHYINKIAWNSLNGESL